MNVMILGVRPTLLGELVHGGKTSFGIRHVVVNEYSMIDGHWPQRKASLVGPVDGTNLLIYVGLEIYFKM